MTRHRKDRDCRGVEPVLPIPDSPSPGQRPHSVLDMAVVSWRMPYGEEYFLGSEVGNAKIASAQLGIDGTGDTCLVEAKLTDGSFAVFRPSMIVYRVVEF